MHHFENPCSPSFAHPTLILIATCFIEIADAHAFRIDLNVSDTGLLLGLTTESVFLSLTSLHVTFRKVEMAARILEDEVFTRTIRSCPKEYATDGNLPDYGEAKKPERLTQ